MKMSIQLDHKSVDLVKRRLPQIALQLIHVFKMMVIVPVDMPQLQVRPVDDAALRKPKCSLIPTQ